jgi:hypothetical protein
MKRCLVLVAIVCVSSSSWADKGKPKKAAFEPGAVAPGESWYCDKGFGNDNYVGCYREKAMCEQENFSAGFELNCVLKKKAFVVTYFSVDDESMARYAGMKKGHCNKVRKRVLKDFYGEVHSVSKCKAVGEVKPTVYERKPGDTADGWVCVDREKKSTWCARTCQELESRAKGKLRCRKVDVIYSSRHFVKSWETSFYPTMKECKGNLDPGMFFNARTDCVKLEKGK